MLFLVDDVISCWPNFSTRSTSFSKSAPLVRLQCKGAWFMLKISSQTIRSGCQRFTENFNHAPFATWSGETVAPVHVYFGGSADCRANKKQLTARIRVGSLLKRSLGTIFHWSGSQASDIKCEIQPLPKFSSFECLSGSNRPWFQLVFCSIFVWIGERTF